MADRQKHGASSTTPTGTQPDAITSEVATAEVVDNICKPIVDASAAFIGQMPMVRVPSMDSRLDSLAITEKTERIALGLLRAWNMPRRMMDVGRYCSMLGTAVGVIWPDMEKMRPKFLVRSPRGFCPTPKDEDGYELADAIFYAKYSGAQAAKMFGAKGKKYVDEKEVEVYEYIDDKVIVTVVGDDVVRRINHKLGFCPVVAIPNTSIPGSCFGESTLANGAPKLQQWNSYIFSKVVAQVQEMLDQPLVIEGAEHFPEEIPRGPRDTIELPAGVGAKVYRVPPMIMPFDIFRIRDDLEKSISMVSDIPQAMTSGGDNPYESGRGFTAKLAPTQSKLKVKLDTIYPAIERLLWMAFTMWEVMWPNEEHTVFGELPKGMNQSTAKSNRFTETFKMEDLRGWYQFEVTLDPGSFFDQQTQWVMTLQGVQNQILSKETAMQYFPLIKDVVIEKQRVAREVQENAQMNIQAQAAALAMQNAPMAEVGRTGYGIEKGYVGELPVPPMPGGADVKAPAEAPANGQVAEPGKMVDPLIQQMIDLLRSVPKVKGQIFVTGEFLDENYREQTSGMGSTPTVTICLTVAADKATLINYIKSQVPEMFGSMKFRTVTGPPNEPYIDASGGTNGYETQGNETPSEGPNGLPGGTSPLPKGGQANQEDIAAIQAAIGGANP